MGEISNGVTELNTVRKKATRKCTVLTNNPVVWAKNSNHSPTKHAANTKQ